MTMCLMLFLMRKLVLFLKSVKYKSTKSSTSDSSCSYMTYPQEINKIKPTKELKVHMRSYNKKKYNKVYNCFNSSKKIKILLSVTSSNGIKCTAMTSS